MGSAFSLTSCYRKLNPFCNINKQHSWQHRAKLLLWPGQRHIQGECVPTEQQLQKCVRDTESTYFQWVQLSKPSSSVYDDRWGLEHCVNFESVKIPLILMFTQLKLDSLIAICTAPGQSYVNIVEQIMSILKEPQTISIYWFYLLHN